MATGGHGDFGRLLRARRRAAGLTQEQLASRAGLSPRSDSDLERGVRRPYLRTIAQLAGALELDQAARAELADALTCTTRPAEPAEPAAADRMTPRQLPASVPGFVGRGAELSALSELAGQTGDRNGAVVISAIGGTAGVGKTALAVRWAHQVAERFPDGQLYVNLCGYDVDQPMAPGDALAGFLRALGVAGPDVPAGEQERAARYRSMLAGRRVLVVLDNAGTADQVRPLLPGSEGCMAVVTSRDTMTGLVVRDGARRLDLDLLPSAEARALLRELIGDRAAGDPEATTALAGLCARLPLALRVAAEHVVSRPAVVLCNLVHELGGQDSRLDVLSAGGDARTAVRAVFSWSCRGLAAQTLRMFRLLGLHPGPDLDWHAAAALAGCTLAQARRLLDLLAAAYLVQPAQPGRYGLHDLLRAYGWPQHATRLSRTLYRYLENGGHAPEAVIILGHALRAARLASDRHADATALTDLVLVGITQGRYEEAVGWLRRSRDLFHELGDSSGEARALGILGTLDFHLGRGDYELAAGYLESAQALSRETGERNYQAESLNSLGDAELRLGRHELAADCQRQALALCCELGDRAGETLALNSLGETLLAAGRVARAQASHAAALDVAQRIGIKDERARAHHGLGQACHALGDQDQARDHWQQALTLYTELGFPEAEQLRLRFAGA